jgi:hypothetical protein
MALSTRSGQGGSQIAMGGSQIAMTVPVTFTDSIDVCAVTIMSDALYRTYSCPATVCGGHGPGELPGPWQGRETAKLRKAAWL